MALNNLRALALAFPIVITALAPDSADACPYGGEPCAEFDFWSDLAPTNAAKIPADGVLLLQGAHQGGDDSEWLAKGPDAEPGTKMRVAGHDGVVLVVEHLH